MQDSDYCALPRIRDTARSCDCLEETCDSVGKADHILLEFLFSKDEDHPEKQKIIIVWMI